MFLQISIKFSEKVDINPLTTNVPHYIENSQLFDWFLRCGKLVVNG